MLRLALRILGFLALAAGMAAGVVDGARGIANGGFRLASLADTAAALFPKQFPHWGAGVSQALHPLIWDPLLTTVLMLPAVVAMFALGALLLLLASPPGIAASEE